MEAGTLAHTEGWRFPEVVLSEPLAAHRGAAREPAGPGTSKRMTPAAAYACGAAPGCQRPPRGIPMDAFGSRRPSGRCTRCAFRGRRVLSGASRRDASVPAPRKCRLETRARVASYQLPGEFQLGRHPGRCDRWGLGLDAAVGENLAHDRASADQRDQLACSAAVRANENVDLEGTAFILRLPQWNRPSGLAPESRTPDAAPAASRATHPGRCRYEP